MLKECTPIQKLNNIYQNNKIYVKREDLYPFSFGGNKVKIGKEFIKDAINKECDVIISYGSPKSNLNRAMVSLCIKNKLDCFIVSPIENDEKKELNFNQKLNLLNIPFDNICECKKDEVSLTIKNLLEKLKNSGKKPYYINGDIYGKGNEKISILAYQKCYEEIEEFQKENSIKFDYIFLASGTGMTQSGLILGQNKSESKIKSKIIGISIARREKQGKEAIERYLRSELNEEEIKKIEIEFIDDYLSGGYGKFTKEIKNKVIEIYKKEGIPLDLTYTGKAFYGMEEYLKTKEIKDKNILFLHTGGTPLFFDDIY